jgi:rare lipoprotein A
MKNTKNPSLPMKKFILTLILMLGLISGINAQQYSATGLASYYADKFDGRQTASGEIYSHSKLTAAHPTLPFGTMLKVTNLKNGKSVIVRVNDRGPFVNGRIIDLSKNAAIKIDAIRDGLVKVKIEQTHTSQESESQQISQNEYYHIDVSSQVLSGYGVQIGSFSQMDNLIRLSDQVKKEIQDNMYVQVARVKGKLVNRLIVGVETTKEKADKNQKQLQMVFPGCFVVQL